ncbi:hypothetical protein NE237_024055 [Protea cynaroides]|uniref:Uncharacterized protein n=1 Tax=Protea cynaroides TaxID=273540 RepID=A0A9Q0HCN3_9MAGN|nr:hypothetical protein NE237_024055 [Protea cynaroides]
MMLRVYARNPMPRLSDGWVASAVRRWARVGFSCSHAGPSTGRMVSSSVVSTGRGEGDLPVREISALPHLRFPKEKMAHQQGLGVDLVEEAPMSSVAGNPMLTIDFGSSGREWSSLSMMTALAGRSDCAARCYQNPSVRTMDAYMESQTKNKAPGTLEIVAEASVEGNRPLGEETGRGAGELGLNHALSQGTCDDTRVSAQRESLASSVGTPTGDASLASGGSMVSSAIDGLVFWQWRFYKVWGSHPEVISNRNQGILQLKNSSMADGFSCATVLVL